MRHKLFSASCMVAIAVIGAAPAYADPVGHGNMCGSPSSANPASMAPGNSATSPGSTHNEPLASGTPVVSVNGGTGGAAYNFNTRTGPGGVAHNGGQQPSGAPSNYDTSCGNVTAASANNPNSGAGTPILTTPSGATQTQVPNNSLVTRTAEGVTSHSTFVHNSK